MFVFMFYSCIYVSFINLLNEWSIFLKSPLYVYKYIPILFALLGTKITFVFSSLCQLEVCWWWQRIWPLSIAMQWKMCFSFEDAQFPKMIEMLPAKMAMELRNIMSMSERRFHRFHNEGWTNQNGPKQAYDSKNNIYICMYWMIKV